MKAVIEPGCIGCGLCEATCPEVFRLNEESQAEVIGDVTEELEDAAKEAEGNCPVSVIEVQ